jgi:hypothetical protein
MFSTIIELVNLDSSETTEHVTTGHDVYTSVVSLLCIFGEEVNELQVAVAESYSP